MENKDSDLPQQDEVALEDRINIELAKIKSIIEEDIREGGILTIMKDFEWS